MKIKTAEFLKLKRLINKHSTFLISSHVNVEPDALGSELAFARLLKSFGKKVKIINDEKLPRRFKFMPGSEDILSYSAGRVDFDVAVILDCSDLNRTGRVRHLVDKHERIINLDHHVSNVRFGDVNIVDEHASSASEIVYRIFKAFNLKLDRDSAFNLYCGILTDTGSFHYSNTTSETFNVASELVSFGLDVNAIYGEVYKIDSLKNVKIIGRYLQQARSYKQGKVVYLPLPQISGIDEHVARDLAEEALGILRLIYKAKVFALLRQLPNGDYIRMNLRSNSNVNVNKIAHVFNGGGHMRAASATVKGRLNQVKNRLLKEIAKYLR